ncbi:MAG: Superoxide dismutase [Ni] [Alphaproteobacteria bacterium MarineAlpha2_Bin1]|nr:MAG: Superoxide dismutase [Ni] [Alphaproteobacteria bacterium MarineAlpha2_Bin1]
MIKFILRNKFLILITFSLNLLISPAVSHPVKTAEIGINHVLLSNNHLLFFIFLGILVAFLMISKRLLFVILGNISLFGYLVYLSITHIMNQGLLFGLEIFLVGGFISLLSWRVTYWLFIIYSENINKFKLIPYQKLRYLDKIFKFNNVKAHCDIPCKIYDPSTAIIATLSVIRLIDIINETHSNKDRATTEYENTMARCILRKEEESEKLKQEIRIIWGDYFKDPQIEAFPEIHNITHKIMMLASAAKQKVNRKEADQLLELVNQFSEIFWSTKNIETERKISPYPPSLAVVRPKL